MRKLTFIFTFLFVIFSFSSSFADIEKDTDFAPFPLSLSSEGLLNGLWESEAGYLEIVESDFYSINDSRWFIVYESQTQSQEDREVVGYIYYDVDIDDYQRVSWSDDGIETGPFTLYSREERTGLLPDDAQCESMSIYMLKINEAIYTRSECSR